LPGLYDRVLKKSAKRLHKATLVLKDLLLLVKAAMRRERKQLKETTLERKLRRTGTKSNGELNAKLKEANIK
jgi:hypothetical protein